MSGDSNDYAYQEEIERLQEDLRDAKADAAEERYDADREMDRLRAELPIDYGDAKSVLINGLLEDIEKHEDTIKSLSDLLAEAIAIIRIHATEEPREFIDRATSAMKAAKKKEPEGF